MQKIKVIIPAYNEENSIGSVVKDIPGHVDEVIVVSNNSKDQTELRAKNAGATVLTEDRPGYGYACLKGMSYVASQVEKPDIIVFLDGDYSDYPEQLDELVAPIIEDDIDNWLATTLMHWFFKSRFTDLGPFRAIKYDKLLALKMEDKTYGWTVEMQLKALKQKLTYIEIPVKYRNRIGVSKVSGTVKGAIFAGVKILGWIFKYSFK